MKKKAVYQLNQSQKMMVFVLSMSLYGLATLFTEFLILGLVIIFIRLAFQHLIIGYAAKKFKEQDLIPFILFFELFLIFSQLSIFISNRGEKNPRWK